MDMDLVSSALAMRQGQTQQLVQIAVLRKSHEMEMDLLQMLDTAARQAPPADGTGRVVDKTA
jgi:hypothetical protein